MIRLTRFSPIALLALAVLISTAGCKSNQNAATSGQSATPDSSSDPAAANLAPAATSDTQASTAPAASSAQSAPAPAQSAPAPAPAPAESAPGATESNASVSNLPVATDDDTSYGATPVATAPEPPPAIPEYQQPPAPADDYLWTPGYWNYASAGYYWVPGVWVQAPYQGALWTPGYWGYYHSRYSFFHGYWGPHIGFYGGVNYGFGYGGAGYQGGYWNRGHFAYNRAVNNINISVIHNVYEYKVVTNNNVRVSFNGGPGGLQVRARPAELVAAFREPHAPPMRAQMTVEHTASINRSAFVSANQGHPTNAAIDKPLAADRDVHPVPPPAPRFTPPGRSDLHPGPGPAHNAQPVRPAERPTPRAEAAPRAGHPVQPRTEERPAPHAAPHPQASQPRPQEHPAAHPATHPAAKPAAHEPGKPAPKHEDEHPR